MRLSVWYTQYQPNREFLNFEDNLWLLLFIPVPSTGDWKSSKISKVGLDWNRAIAIQNLPADFSCLKCVLALVYPDCRAKLSLNRQSSSNEYKIYGIEHLFLAKNKRWLLERVRLDVLWCKIPGTVSMTDNYRWEIFLINKLSSWSW